SAGVGGVARDGAEDEPGRLGGLATELLALVLLERDGEVGEHRVEDGRALQRSLRERGIDPGDRGAGVVDDVALRLHQLSESRPGFVGARAGAGRRQPAISAVAVAPSAGAAAPRRARAASARRARHSWLSTLIASSHTPPPARPKALARRT